MNPSEVFNSAFNSIKVRVKSIPTWYKGYRGHFQFHKGASKTLVWLVPGLHSFNSIKVRVKPSGVAKQPLMRRLSIP